MKKTAKANKLIAALSRKDQLGFIARCKKVDLKLDNSLYEPGVSIRYVYFPIDGYISVISQVDAGSSMEIALVGNEGMIGIAPTLGISDSMLHVFVQGEGTALRMKSTLFRQELQRKPALRKILDRYIFARISQIAQIAACTRYHVIESRLARWLLLRQDLAFSNDIPITQLSLAYMLGVRRVGITKAASALQFRNIITYTRGILTITNRKGLEAASCECYQKDKDIYNRIMA